VEVFTYKEQGLKPLLNSLEISFYKIFLSTGIAIKFRLDERKGDQLCVPAD
jgi:hypothetical protein